MTPDVRGGDDAGVHQRFIRWQLRVGLALASRRLDLPFATYLISDDLPDVYDANRMELQRMAPPALVLQSMERVARSVGWSHRRIVTADETLTRHVREPLLAAGYDEQRLVTMALRNAPAAVDTAGVAVVDVAEQLDLARTLNAAQPWGHGDDLLDQFAAYERRLAAVTGGRAVIAPADAPVSRCLLLTDGDGLYEIDAVSTLASRRGQGWSRAVVQRAIAEARRHAARHVVLVADDDDWPRSWYERLGFTTVGRFSSFQRLPRGTG